MSTSQNPNNSIYRRKCGSNRYQTSICQTSSLCHLHLSEGALQFSHLIVIAQLLCLSHDAKLEKNRWWYATQLMSLASITRKHSLFKTCGKLCHIFDGEIFCPKVDLQKLSDFCHPQFCQIVVTPHLNILQTPPLWLTSACREMHLIPSESLWVLRGKFPWYHF